MRDMTLACTRIWIASGVRYFRMSNLKEAYLQHMIYAFDNFQFGIEHRTEISHTPFCLNNVTTHID